jgi:hypothetical protein
VTTPITPDVVANALSDQQLSPQLRDEKWNLIPGEITAPGTVTVLVKLDGEGFGGSVAVPIPAISLIGPLTLGERVMILRVPPSGNYVISSAQSIHMTMDSFVDDVMFNSNNVTYTTAGAAALIGFAFTVPPSGKVLFQYGGFMSVATAGHAAYISIQIQEGDTLGSGTMTLTASDDNAVIVANTAGNPDRQGVSYLFKTGVVGNVYNATLMHRTTGAVGTFDSRYLIIQY